MNMMRQAGWTVATVMSFVFGGQAAPQSLATARTSHTVVVKRELVVSLEDRKLALVEDGKVTKIYRVAVGKPSTPSPVGTFTIERRVMNPTYSHDGRVVPPGPNNPVGDRWMSLSIRGYGIHGTNVPSSIGQATSHGCIRMGKADVEDLFSRVEVGDTVELIGTPNAETAELFGDGPKPALVAQPRQTVIAATHPEPAAAATSGSM
jgi:lipoprotein-anchoring transpeptidase ErfK/SrfK